MAKHQRIVVEVRNDKGELLSKESGEYQLPEDHGMLRIWPQEKKVYC